MFDIQLDLQSFILQRLIWEIYERHQKLKALDFTFGTGALWQEVEDVEITKCDSQPLDENVHKKDIFNDDYDFGLHDFALFDPPYLIGRQGFDYSAKLQDGKLVPMQYQGKRSWGTKGVAKYTANPTVEHFNNRVVHINNKAPNVLKPNGILFVKVMNTRYKKHYVAHNHDIVNLMTNFELVAEVPYIRAGATTWKQKFQNLHGVWLVFRLKDTKPLG